MSHLDDLIDVLWPGHIGGSGKGARRFVVLPDAARPRLLLPLRPWRVSAGALRRYSTSLTGSRLGVVRLGAAGLRMGVGEVWPHRIDLVPSGGAGIDAHLRDVLGRDLEVALYVGPPRAVEKPVLQVLDHSGRTFAFAKLSINDTTAGLIRREAAALAIVGAARLAHVRAPRILHHGTWNGHELLVQEALARRGAGQVSPQLLTKAGAEVAGLGRSSGAPFCGVLSAQLGRLGPSDYRDLLRRMLPALVSHGGGPLELGGSHGDWTPWNMTASEGRLLVWDWEGFTTGMPVGFDALHHRLNDLVTYAGVTVLDAFATVAADRSQLVGAVGGRAPTLTLALYTMYLATTYLENGEDQVAGTPLSRLDDWLEPTLSSQVTILAREASA